MQKKIIALGGGSFKDNKTLAIDQEIVKISGKKRPHVLFLPTASSDNKEYAANITEHFITLGCTVQTLFLLDEVPSFSVLEELLLSANIIYVGGGNTLMMMRLWRKIGIDTLLIQAYQKGIVLCGLSAGSICWFKQGNSDSRKYKNPNADFIKVTGLGLINALHCPHYDSESERKESLKRMMKKTSGIALALEDYCALQIVDTTYRIISAQKGASAYKIYWKKGVFFEEKIEVSPQFKSLTMLLSR